MKNITTMNTWAYNVQANPHDALFTNAANVLFKKRHNLNLYLLNDSGKYLNR